MTRNDDTARTGTQVDPRAGPGLTPLTSWMNTAGALIVLAMMVIVNIDVFGRWLFNTPGRARWS